MISVLRSIGRLSVLRMFGMFLLRLYFERFFQRLLNLISTSQFMICAAQLYLESFLMRCICLLEHILGSLVESISKILPSYRESFKTELCMRLFLILNVLMICSSALLDVFYKNIIEPSLFHILTVWFFQLIVASSKTITVIQRLEQVVSNGEHAVNATSECLLDVLSKNPSVADMIDSVRNFNQSERRRIAMATRENRLRQLGMTVNSSGQVRKSSKSSRN